MRHRAAVDASPRLPGPACPVTRGVRSVSWEGDDRPEQAVDAAGPRSHCRDRPSPTPDRRPARARTVPVRRPGADMSRSVASSAGGGAPDRRSGGLDVAALRRPRLPRRPGAGRRSSWPSPPPSPAQLPLAHRLSKLASRPPGTSSPRCSGCGPGSSAPPGWPAGSAGPSSFVRDLGLRFRWIDLIGIPIGVGGQYPGGADLHPHLPPRPRLQPAVRRPDPAADRRLPRRRVRRHRRRHRGGRAVLRGALLPGGAAPVAGPTVRDVGGWVGPALAIVITGVLFGLAHAESLQLLGLAIFGIILSAVSYRTGRLGMNMVAHASFNLVAVAAVVITRGCSAPGPGSDMTAEDAGTRDDRPPSTTAPVPTPTADRPGPGPGARSLGPLRVTVDRPLGLAGVGQRGRPWSGSRWWPSASSTRRCCWPTPPPPGATPGPTSCCRRSSSRTC